MRPSPGQQQPQWQGARVLRGGAPPGGKPNIAGPESRVRLCPIRWRAHMTRSSHSGRV